MFHSLFFFFRDRNAPFDTAPEGNVKRGFLFFDTRMLLMFFFFFFVGTDPTLRHGGYLMNRSVNWFGFW
jgi:hypothetical protein